MFSKSTVPALYMFSTAKPSLILLLVILMSGLPGKASAQIEQAVQAFDEGNDAYRMGNYQGAIHAYQSAIDGGFTSSALYYNLGNAYFRLDELGQAVRFYEKARLLSPENEELLHNLEIAQSKTIDQFSRLPAPAWVAWWNTLVARTGGKWLFVTGLFFYFFAVGLFIHRIRTSTRNPWFRRARSLTLLMALVFLGAGFSASVQSVETVRAVILTDQVDLQEAASTESSSSLSIHEGLVVDIMQQQGAWTEVRIPNGTRGWVATEVLGEI